MHMKTFEYLIYPNREQHHLLMQCLIKSRMIYNSMLETMKALYERDGTFPSKYDLEAAFKGVGPHVPASTIHRKSQATLRRKQRTMCRRKKESKRRCKACKSVARTYLKIKRQRRDHHFKVAKRYADNYSRIVVEDLQIANMVHNHHLSKSIYDAGWRQFVDILSAKAESAGHRVLRVNPRYTTQECNRCHELVQKSLSVRTHICPFCGYVADRDTNAAQNILASGIGGGTAFKHQRTPMGAA